MPVVTGTLADAALNCWSAVPRTQFADSMTPTRFGAGLFQFPKSQLLLVNLCPRQELVLWRLHAAVPFNEPQVPLIHEPDHVCSVHVSQIIACLIQHVNDSLVNFSANVAKSWLTLFLLLSFILGVCNSTESFCMNQVGQSWDRSSKGQLRWYGLVQDVFTKTPANAIIFSLYGL